MITRSPSIAVALSEHLNIEAISRIRADLYFMGVCSVHPIAGLSIGDYEASVFKRALCQASAETLVLASSEKLATVSPHTVVLLSEIAGLVAPSDVPEALLALYRQMNLQAHEAG